jgi:hypothetical protein
MTESRFERVVELAEQLTAEETEALLDAAVVDLGPVAPDFSFRREDWYGDER